MKVHKRFLNVSAFSLIEMVIVIALLGIVVAMITPMLSSGVRLYTTSKDLTTVTTKAVNAMTRMQKELIDAKAITQATSSRLRITNFDDREPIYNDVSLVALRCYLMMSQPYLLPITIAI